MNKELKKILPKLRFPEFKSSEFWALKKIEEISDQITAGGTPSTTEKSYWGGEIRWMNSGELNLKKVYEVQGRITELGLRNSSTKIIPKNSVLIGLAGQGKTRGTIAMNMVELCINQSISAIYPKPSKYSSDYLYHNLDNRYDELRSLSAGGEGRGGLNLQIIKSLEIPLPEIKEQQKIADCLSSLDDLITAQNQKVEALKQHKKGLMQQLFPAEGETVPKLRFPEFENTEEWKSSSVERFFDRIRNGFVGTATPYYVTNGVPYLQGKNIKNGSIDPTGLTHVTREFHQSQKKSQLSPEDILMVQSGHVGECALVGEAFSGSNCHALIVLSPRPNVNSKYFVHYFYSPHGLERIFKITTGNTIKHILASEMQILNVIAPTYEEQNRIANCLSSLDDLITTQTQQLEAYKTHKKGLMQQLFPSLDEVNA